MILKELIAKIGFQTDETPLNKIEHAIDRVRGRIEMFAAAEIAHKIFEVTEQFAEWGHELEITSESIGVTVEEIQKLQDAAGRFGVESGVLTMGLGILSRHLYDAKKGSETAYQSFARLGISADQVKGFKNSKDALLAISDSFAKMKDPIERSAVAQEVFGRSGRKMVAFLKEGSASIKGFGDAAEAQGRVISKSQTSALARIAIAINRVGSFMRMFWADIASQVGPGIEKFIDLMQAWYIANQKIIKQEIHEWLLRAAYAIGFMIGLLTIAYGWIKKFFAEGETDNQADGKFLKLAFEIGGCVMVAATLAPLLERIYKVIKFILPVFGWLAAAVVFVKMAMAGLIGDLAVWISGAFPMLADAIMAVAAALSSVSVGVLLGVITALTVAIHDLWAETHGEPTWMGALWDLGEKLPIIGKYLKKFREMTDNAIGAFAESSLGQWLFKSGEALTAWFDKIKPMSSVLKWLWGLVSGPATEEGDRIGGVNRNLENMQSPLSVINNAGSSLSSSNSSNNNTINANINLSVPGNLSPSETAGAIHLGIRESLQTVQRATKNQTATAVAH